LLVKITTLEPRRPTKCYRVRDKFEGRTLKTARYEVVGRNDGWAISHAGKVSNGYLTKESAFEAAVAAANAIKEGAGVVITVEAARDNEPALGKR
jgi:hypothetical protein